MKTTKVFLLAALAAVAVPALAQYAPYFTDGLHSFQSANWTQTCQAGGSALVFDSVGMGAARGPPLVI